MAKLSPDLMDLESIMLLSSAKIFSVHDFLQTDVEKIVYHSKLSIEKVLELKEYLVNKYSSSPANTLDLFTSKDDQIFIKTYIEGLDKMLSGGILKGSILEICGLSGCGKTQLCHSITVNCAVNSVLVDFIDTKEDFSASRCNILLPAGLKDEEMDDVLERINVYYTKNIYELTSTLKKIHSNLRAIKGKDKIIIIDSITVPYLPFVGISNNKAFSMLNFIASTLKEIATDCNASIILTNLGVVYNENEEYMGKNNQEIKPLMGKYWQHIPNTRIIISRESESSNIRKLSVHKSDYLEVNRTGLLNISETGIS